MESLPDEVLLQILALLPVSELLGVACRVSLRWEFLSLEAAVWRRCRGGLCYHCDHEWPFPARAATPSLSVHARDDASHVLEEPWLPGGCSVLRRLQLTSCRLTDAGALLRAASRAFPQLRQLGLSECTPIARVHYGILAEFTKLTALNLTMCKELGGDSFRLAITCCSQLRELRLGWTDGLKDDDVLHLVQCLGSNLYVLTLGGCLLTDDAYSALARCIHLEQLGLIPCEGLQDLGLRVGLQSLTKLKSLQLSAPEKLSRIHLENYLISAVSLITLVGLSLGWCEVLYDSGLKIIGNRCQNLARITLKNCRNVTDVGICHIVLGCNKLESVKLVWNDSLIGDGFLPQMVVHLPHLLCLDLSYSENISKDHLQQFLASRQDVSVVMPEVWCRPRHRPHECCGAWEKVA